LFSSDLKKVFIQKMPKPKSPTRLETKQPEFIPASFSVSRPRPRPRPVRSDSYFESRQSEARSERSERSERPERLEPRSERSERLERLEPRSERLERLEPRSERSERLERLEPRSERLERLEPRSERAERLERLEPSERSERLERLEPRSERSERLERLEPRSERHEPRSERSERHEPRSEPRSDDVLHSKVYPELIKELLNVCVREVNEVKELLKNRNRQKFIKVFNGYNKSNLTERDYSIIKSALFYIYDFSRVNSIDKETATWMLGISDIPVSHIITYTSKDILKNIAKDRGLSFSNKKAEELVKSIRGVIDPSV
jgi:hypothetical protein